MAQTYSEKCVFAHNSQRTSQQDIYLLVGENLAATTGTVDYTGLVNNWNNEGNYYDYEENACSRVCGHYTQVRWRAEATSL